MGMRQGGRSIRPSGRNLATTIGEHTLFGILASVVQMGTRIVTVPIVIGHLGLDGYGIWSIIMATAAYLRFGSAGIKSAFQKYVAEATSRGHFENVNKLVSTGSAAMFGLSILGLIPIAMFSRGVAIVLGVPERFLHSTATAISLLALFMLLSNVGAAYEAILMGGNRIDITKKLGTMFTILEAVAIVVCLHVGYGLVAMAGTLALSEVGYLFCCCVASRRILPEIQISGRYVSRAALRQLVGFTGSYQVVSILEIVYASILPVTILRCFGANAAGVYAIGGKLIWAALAAQEATLLPLLSAGSFVYASGSVERMRLLVTKAFKTTLALVILPLVFITSHGPLILLVWVGRAEPAFQMALWLMCFAAFFKSLSLLALVLYRASGRAWMDNVRQALRILVLLLTSLFGHQIGFLGVLAGLAVAELAGLMLMLFAIVRTFHGVTAGSVLRDAARLVIATPAIVFIGTAVANLLTPTGATGRALGMLKLAECFLVSVAVAWPFLLLTGFLSKPEVSAIVGAFGRRNEADA